MAKQSQLPAGVRGAASFTDAEEGQPPKRRQVLVRWWGNQSWAGLSKSKKVLIIGHNPNNAGAHFDDPTSANICRLANAWGYQGVVLVNVFDWICTDPKELRMIKQLASSDNISRIINSAKNVNKAVAAWGVMEPPFNAYAEDIKSTFKAVGLDLWCMGRNLDGSPKHPLYIKVGTGLEMWSKSHA